MENYYNPPHRDYIPIEPYGMRDGYNQNLMPDYNANYDMGMQNSYQATPDFMPKSPSLGMAYVPYQSLNHAIYDDMKALERGTIFEDLDMPFTAKWSVPNG